MINSYSVNELDELSQNDKELRKMDELIKEMSKDPTFLRAGVYDREEMHKNEIMWSRQEGKAEGKAEGRIEGKAEGMAEGRIEGKLETQKEMILKMHENGATLDFISKTSDLSLDKVKEILNINHEDV